MKILSIAMIASCVVASAVSAAAGVNALLGHDLSGILTLSPTVLFGLAIALALLAVALHRRTRRQQGDFDLSAPELSTMTFAPPPIAHRAVQPRVR